MQINNLTKSLNVLLVDDDNEVIEKMKELFLLFFKEVDIATNAKKALEKMKQNSYDIIFSDILMPEMDGIELLKIIKNKNKNQKVILVTAYSDSKYLFEAIENGADGFLVKPIKLEKLILILKRVASVIQNEKLIKNFNEVLQKELKKKIKEIEFKTYYDELTLLKNRTALLKDIKNKKSITILNINNFDSVNIVYGYEKGDELLKYVASYLKQFEDVYYLGNDEFAILKDIDINSILIPHFKIDDSHFMPIDFTIGIAKGDNLLKKASLALKEAKRKGKKCVIYSRDLDIEKFQLKVNKYLPLLKEAIKNEQIIPFFQGIYDNKLKKITKYEVLARIKSDNEIISPNNFIDIAQKGGFITDITKQIIDKSFRVFSNNDYEFSINLTDADLRSDELIDYLLEKTKYYNIKKDRIILEVLEGIGQIENSAILDKLRVLEKLGFKIAIDDFGTMHSNFERFMFFKADYIKIDGKFIKNIANDNNSYAITKAISEFAKSINAKVIAEYVENEKIQNIIENLGIDYSQGYLFSKPKERLC